MSTSKNDLDAALSRAIQQWLLNQSTAEAKALAVELNLQEGPRRSMVRRIISAVDTLRPATAQALMLQRQTEFLTDAVQWAVEEVKKELIL